MAVAGLKRSLDLVASHHFPESESKRIRMACKVKAEFGALKNSLDDQGPGEGKPQSVLPGTQATKDAPEKGVTDAVVSGLRRPDSTGGKEKDTKQIWTPSPCSLEEL